MAYCETEVLFYDFSSLLKKVSDGEQLSPADQRKLASLLKSWHTATCPDEGCYPGKCLFANPSTGSSFMATRASAS